MTHTIIAHCPNVLRPEQLCAQDLGSNSSQGRVKTTNERERK